MRLRFLPKREIILSLLPYLSRTVLDDLRLQMVACLGPTKTKGKIVDYWRTAIIKGTDSVRKHFALFGTKGVLRRALVGLPGLRNEFLVSLPNSSEKVL